MKASKTSNYLAHTGHKFKDYHLNTTNQIYTGLAEGNLLELGQINNSVLKSVYWQFKFDNELKKHSLI